MPTAQEEVARPRLILGWPRGAGRRRFECWCGVWRSGRCDRRRRCFRWRAGLTCGAGCLAFAPTGGSSGISGSRSGSGPSNGSRLRAGAGDRTAGAPPAAAVGADGPTAASTGDADVTLPASLPRIERLRLRHHLVSARVQEIRLREPLRGQSPPPGLPARRWRVMRQVRSGPVRRTAAGPRQRVWRLRPAWRTRQQSRALPRQAAAARAAVARLPGLRRQERACRWHRTRSAGRIRHTGGNWPSRDRNLGTTRPLRIVQHS